MKPLPFLYQILERVARHPYYYFLNGYSGYYQIPITVEAKKRPHLDVPLEHLHLEECHLGFVMLLQNFKDVC